MATAPVAAVPVAAAPAALDLLEFFSPETPAATRIATKVRRIKIMEAIANNEPNEGKKVVLEVFIAELKMLLEKEHIEDSQDLQSLLAERVEYWIQSLANLPDGWNRSAHRNHIYELKTLELQLNLDGFCGSEVKFL